MNDKVLGLGEKEEMAVLLWCKMMSQLSRKAKYKLSQPDRSAASQVSRLIDIFNKLPASLGWTFSLPGNFWRLAGSWHWRWTCEGRKRNPGMFAVWRRDRVGRGPGPPAPCTARAAGDPPWSRSPDCRPGCPGCSPGCPPWYHPWSSHHSRTATETSDQVLLPPKQWAPAPARTENIPHQRQQVKWNIF